MDQLDVIIVGAGAAGLAAAHALAAAGRSSMILEARDRVGGRIWTVHSPSFSLPIELGAEFVHGRPAASWNLIEQAGLTLYEVPFDNYELRGKHLAPTPHLTRTLNQIMSGLQRVRGTDISFAEYLRWHASAVKFAHARRLAKHFVKGFDAADPNLISSKSLAEEQQALGDLEHESQYRLIEGYAGLLDYMSRSLKPNHVEQCLNTVVEEICWRHLEVIVRCRCGEERFMRTARHCIVTLPLGVLQQHLNATNVLAQFLVALNGIFHVKPDI